VLHGGDDRRLLDPETGLVVAERAVPDAVLARARLPDGIVLVPGHARIGPGRLAVVGPEGARADCRAPADARRGSPARAGHGHHADPRSRGRSGEPAGPRLGADEPVAEVDLRTLRVTYRVPAPVRSLQARTKIIRGPYRTADRVGDGVLALTGTNAHRVGGTRFETAGVHLIDTRTWERRTVASRAQVLSTTGTTVVVPLADRPAAFAPDGKERFGVAGRFGRVQAVDGRAYAWRDEEGMLVVDVASGSTTPSAVAARRPCSGREPCARSRAARRSAPGPAAQGVRRVTNRAAGASR
jgi:hypothetical protein